MSPKFVFAVATLCLVHFLLEVETSFIKPNNVPRVGRSNEGEGPYEQNLMGYVIKTIPSKNIPRMGRRNFDSENRYDIPKLYQVPASNFESFDDQNALSQLSQEQEEFYRNN
ncbi:uncharacterized protein LOC121739748 [Aricia agestis]|uniref:uncharacterized protein LOC121739748 n=1 Tax=Aricia agestis TaxID=91739 RepID=UPI001C20310F|nr:uncharacterized protein LOC121739748 [Aricia agestis]